MSWQEKIERHQQEQTWAQNEVQRKLREEQERQKREKVEKIKPLLQVLEDLKCRETLSQIRDEIWKLGDVTVSPELGSVTHKTPIEAWVVLMAEWTKFGRIGCSSGGRDDYRTWDEYGVVTHTERLAIKVVPGSEHVSKYMPFYPEEVSEDKIKIVIETRLLSKWAFLDHNTPTWLEKQLTEDCLRRKDPPSLPPLVDDHMNYPYPPTPYDIVAKRDAVR